MSTDKNNHSLSGAFNYNQRYEDYEFWAERNGKCFIKQARLRRFLELNGFSRIKSFQTSQVVRISGSVAKVYDPQDVFNFVDRYLQIKDNERITEAFLKDGTTFLVRNKTLLGSLKNSTKEKFKDTKESGLLFFKNCFVEVNKEDFITFGYEQLSKKIEGHYIFENQIINRSFTKKNKPSKSQFSEFLTLSTNNIKHFNNVCSSIGYLLHRYKNPSLSKAIILSDILSQATNEANGRSGKGLIIKAIGELVNIIEHNGKNINLSKDKFVYQSITSTTDIFVLQDVSKDFQFEDLFPFLTDKLTVEKKRTDKFVIEFENSPKIAISTNYTMPEKGYSFEDRRQVILLNNHFNSKFKPSDHFGNLFFIEWDDTEFNLFYSFMISCMQLFLKEGLVGYEDDSLLLKKLESETSALFIEVMENQFNSCNSYYLLKDIADLSGIIEENMSVKSRIASNWIKLYANYKNYKIDTRESGGVIKICFLKQ